MGDMVDAELRRMLDERAIRRLLLEYCRGIDRCDAELVASVYHPDATDDHGAFKGSGHEFAAYAVERLSKAYVATQHFLGDSIVNFAGDDVADVETYVLAYHRSADDQIMSFGGRYVDRVERRDGVWKIADRVVIHEWDTSAPCPPYFPTGRFLEGARDRTDLAYRRS
jgi:uncharacterized protein (TIGR02246 family)